VKAIIQRVSYAKVTVDDKIVGQIGRGILVLLGVTHEDTVTDADYLLDKIVNLRIFPDENDKMNLSLQDIRGDLLVVSQFTIYGDTRKGRRPSFTESANPQLAEDLYNYFVSQAENKVFGNVQTGIFAAMMKVELLNDGPVTFIVESKK